jgi:hypothetical protein
VTAFASLPRMPSSDKADPILSASSAQARETAEAGNSSVPTSKSSSGIGVAGYRERIVTSYLPIPDLFSHPHASTIGDGQSCYTWSASLGELGCTVAEVMLKTRNWAFLCVAVVGVALFGCGGHSSSSSNTTTTGTTGSSRPASATVSIPNEQTGVAFIDFLSGQGRDAGDLYVNIEDLLVTDSFHQVTDQRNSSSPIRLDLDQYQIQYATIDVNTTGLDSETFDSFTFIPFSFATEQTDGTVALNPSDSGYIAPDPSISANPLPIRLTVFPGRDSIMPVFLSSAMFAQTSAGTEGFSPQPPVSGTQTNFQIVNEPSSGDPTTSGKIVGFLSDYIQFDIGSSAYVGTRPTLHAGTVATHFYMSGDGYAESDDPVNPSTGDYSSATVGGIFEELTYDPTNPVDGNLAQPGALTQTGSSTPFPTSNFPGTYSLQQANPTDLTGLSRITSMYGRWRNIKDLAVLSRTTFDLIIFPNSAESYTKNVPADCVAFTHNGNTITNMYAGFAYFTGSGGGTPEANLFPLPYFANPTVFTGATGEVDFDLSSFVNANGTAVSYEPDIRNGLFQVDAHSPSSLPSGFASSGSFVVFR